MNIGIIIHTNEQESVWNAFRYGNFAMKDGDGIKVFLIGRGVEAETLDTDKFTVTQEMKDFVKAGGKIFACGTCLKLPTRGRRTSTPWRGLKTCMRSSGRATGW